MDFTSNKRFCLIYPHTLRFEGGYVNNPNDPGGATKFGIAFNYNQGILKTFNIVTPAQMRSLSKDQALSIYYRKYWIPSQSDEIPDIGLSFVYFDFAVNAGIGQADKTLGQIGDKRWPYMEGDGANKLYWQKLIDEYLNKRRAYYRRLAGNPKFAQFLQGWLNRVNHNEVVLQSGKLGIAYDL